jgi:probable F420-dependent oxidoreductase
MADRLKLALFGLHWLQNTDPATLVRQAQLAEEVGFEALWVGDHIALPADAEDQPRLEAVVALTYLAAATKQVRLGAGVIVLPQRQPVLLAKQLSSIDILSQGRLTVGVGVGYIREELQALGVPFAERGRRTDEYISAMLTLWKESSTSFAGDFVSFAGVVEHPRPIQRPYPPLIFGGQGPSAYRRAIQVGNGWYGWELDLEQTAQALAELREVADRYERPAELGKLEISITPPGIVTAETARRYADIGVHRLVVQPSIMDGAAMEGLIRKVAETLIGQI